MITAQDYSTIGRNVARTFFEKYVPTPTLDPEPWIAEQLDVLPGLAPNERRALEVCVRYWMLMDNIAVFDRRTVREHPYTHCEVCGGLLATSTDAPHGVTHIASDGETLTMCGTCHDRTKTKENDHA